MVDSLNLLRGAWVVMVALSLLLGMELLRWRNDATYNQAIIDGDYALAASVTDGARALAARAYATPDEQFDEKVVLLSQLTFGASEAGDPLFNLANLYLRRAIALDAQEDQDIVVPLVEQAKQHYRSLLEVRPDDWDAKFNLELSLTLLPEVEALESDEESNPERSERAISTMRVEEQLP
jgi:mxaK protein